MNDVNIGSSNEQEPKYVNPSVGAVVGGVLAGTVVKGLVNLPLNEVNPRIVDKMVKLNTSLTADEFSQVKNAIETTIKKSGLEAKGLKIIDVAPENMGKISQMLKAELDNNFCKKLPKNYREFMKSINIQNLVEGKNAYYLQKTNNIVVPSKKLGLAVFHELGHAMNRNLSKVGKILQKCRNLTLLTIPISLIALLKTKKAPGEEPKTKGDKVTTFVKNNAGKLTFAAFIPVLMEEGLATLKGNKFAKKLLSPELAKKVAKTNALGFSSYILAATLSSLGIYLATKVKDAIASKKLVTENK